MSNSIPPPPPESSTSYDAHHERILELKEAVGENFWALGEELMRMQRECRQCGFLPLGDQFKGNQRKSTCPQCKQNSLGLYKIHHKRFGDYLKHARIHRQTAYRKIAIYETYEPLVPLISQFAPTEYWNDDDENSLEDPRHTWARRYLSRIGWTILEAIQKRVAAEEDELQIIRIIEEASESSREAQRAQLSGRSTDQKSDYVHRKRIESLSSSLKEIERCLRENQTGAAREWLRALAQEAARIAVLIESDEYEINDAEAVGPVSLPEACHSPEVVAA